MSMFADIGAETAANEILFFVQKKIEENRDKPEVVKVLREVETKAKQISDAAKDGWY